LEDAKLATPNPEGLEPGRLNKHPAPSVKPLPMSGLEKGMGATMTEANLNLASHSTMVLGFANPVPFLITCCA